MVLRQRTSGRRARWVAPEVLERRLLLAQTIVSEGPITRITVGEDNAFQVRRVEFTGGQLFRSSSEPADGGFFVRFAGGRVNGINASQSGAASSTQSLPFTSVSQTISNDGLTITNVMRENQAPAGAALQVTQTTTYRPGDEFFKVTNQLQNLGDTPLTIDAFVAADIFLANSDRGVGFRDASTGSIGGTDASGVYNIFFQPDASGLPPDHFQESRFSQIWSAIGTGGHFNDTVLLPEGPAPYTSDPSYVDNGIGLEWREETIAPGGTITVAYFAGFGEVTSVSPTAQFQAGAPATSGAMFKEFTVIYADELGVSTSSIGDDDITVTGPNGFSAAATPQSQVVGEDLSVTVVYRVAAPGGRFDPADNGTYAVSVNPNSVFDTENVAFASGQIGTFGVSVTNPVGALDPNFGPGASASAGSGIVTFDPPGPPLRTTDIIPLSDGGSIGLAFTENADPLDSDITLFRTDENGDLVSSFGGNGTGLAVLNISTTDRASAILQLPDGKFLVAGTVGTVNLAGTAEDETDFFVARFNADGTLDTDFGDSAPGISVADFGDPFTSGDGSFDRANDLAVLADGSIILFGQTNVNDPDGDVALAKFNADGFKDENFGNSGTVVTDLGGIDLINTVTLDAEGKLVAAGSTSQNPAAGTFAVVRYNVDGTVDTAFGTNGILLIDFLPGLDAAKSIAMQDDGNIVVGGIATSGDPNGDGFDADFAIARFSAAGVLDSTFAGDGTTTVDFPGQLASINKLIIQPGNRIVASGQVVSSLNAVGVESVQTAIARLNADGSLDTGFGDDGRVIIPIGDITGPAPAPSPLDESLFVFQTSTDFGEIQPLALTDLESRFEQFRQDSQGLVALSKGGAILILATQGPNVQIARLVGDAGAPSLFIAVIPTINEIDVSAATFVVRYVDDLLVDASSLGTGDIRVTGPNGFNQLATFVDFAGGDSANAAEVTVRYRITPPGSAFLKADEGDYAIAVEGNSVSDVNGSFLQAATIPDGGFTVTIPEDAANLRVDGPLTGRFPVAVVGGAKASGGAVRVTNAGVQDARTTVTVTVYASTDNELDELTDASIAVINNVKLNLKVGKSRSVRLRFTQYPSNLPDDDYFLIARIDSGNVLTELKKSDNNAATAAPITIAAPFVDLSATPVSLRGVPAPGGRVTATVLARNGGNIAIRQSLSVGILASPGDETVGGGDVTVATAVTRFNLKAGLARNTRIKFEIPSTGSLAPGTYSLLALLDSQNGLAESDETNNLVVLGQFVV